MSEQVLVWHSQPVPLGSLNVSGILHTAAVSTVANTSNMYFIVDKRFAGNWIPSSIECALLMRTRLSHGRCKVPATIGCVDIDNRSNRSCAHIFIFIRSAVSVSVLSVQFACVDEMIYSIGFVCWRLQQSRVLVCEPSWNRICVVYAYYDVDESFGLLFYNFDWTEIYCLS